MTPTPTFLSLTDRRCAYTHEVCIGRSRTLMAPQLTLRVIPYLGGQKVSVRERKVAHGHVYPRPNSLSLGLGYGRGAEGK